jgi:hypothetical protein
MKFDEQFAASAPPELTAPNAAHPHAPLISCLTVASTQAKANLDDLVGGLGLLPYLEPEPSILMTWPGHPTTICKIRAGIWQTDPLKGTKDGPLVFPDPARHYDIHFELQVQQWKARMALFLHYETNPYYSEDKLRSRAASASVAQYYQRREELIRELSAMDEVPGFKISPGTVQVGKAVYDFTGKTVEEVAAWLQPVIDEVACNVNLALYKVELRRKLAAASNSLFAGIATSVNGTNVPAGTASAVTDATQF